MSMEAELCRWSTYNTMLSKETGRAVPIMVVECLLNSDSISASLSDTILIVRRMFVCERERECVCAYVRSVY